MSCSVEKNGDSGSGGGWKQLVMSATWNEIANISDDERLTKLLLHIALIY